MTGTKTVMLEPKAERGEKQGQGTAVAELELEHGAAGRKPREQRNEREGATREAVHAGLLKKQTQSTVRQSNTRAHDGTVEPQRSEDNHD
jgi:hypothetical protein